MDRVELDGRQIAFGDAVARYAALRAKYHALAIDARDDFRVDFARRFETLDGLIDQGDASVQGIVAESIDDAMQSLGDYGIFDIGSAEVAARLRQDYDFWDADFAPVRARHSEIQAAGEAAAAQRLARGGNGPSVIGGGFGVEGALRGMAIAAAANLAIGAVAGAAERTAAASLALRSGKDKRRIFEDPALADHLADAVYRSVFSLHLVVAEIVDARAGAKPQFSMPSAEDMKRAEAIVENLQAGRPRGEARRALMADAIVLNPYGSAAYALWLREYGDADGALARVAATFEIGAVEDEKRRLIEAAAFVPAQATPEACYAAIAAARARAAELGLTDIGPLESKLREQAAVLTERAEALDRERRTVNGVLYDTTKAADAARAEARLFVSGTRHDNASDAQRARVRQWTFVLWIAAAIVAPLPNALVLMRRTRSLKVRIAAGAWLALFDGLLIVAMVSNPPPGKSAIEGLVMLAFWIGASGFFFWACVWLVEKLIRKIVSLLSPIPSQPAAT